MQKGEEQKMTKKVLIITTNTSKITEEIPTGVYLQEFAEPYLTFKNAGYEITVASPLGGESPVDPSSVLCENPTEWDIALKALRNTENLDDVDYEYYDAVFFPGGHGPMFDLANSHKVAKIVETFYINRKVIAAVCHGPAALVLARKCDGTPFVEGKKMTCLSNREEQNSKLDEFMPFMLEDRLIELGAIMEFAEPTHAKIVEDGILITGQNPASTQGVADAVWKKLG